MNKLEIKICGMTDATNIRLATSLRPDWLGLIFHSPSPRCASGLDPAVLPPEVKFAGVFVNASAEDIISTAQLYNLSAVQLHGDESPEFCRSLRGLGFEVWKAIEIAGAADLRTAPEYADAADRIVLDRKSPSRGGTGMKFNWNILGSYPCGTPFMLGGGISPYDAGGIALIRSSNLVGIDLNSRFETAPGIKDIPLLASFISKIRKL